MLCDGCPKGGHYQCLGLPGVPEETGSAPTASRARRRTYNTKVPSSDDFVKDPWTRGSRARHCTTWWITTTTTGRARHERRRRRQSVCDDDDACDKRKSIVSAKLARTISQEKELARLGIVDSPARKSAPKPKRPTQRRRTRVEEDGQAAQVHAEVPAVPERRRPSASTLSTTGVGQAVEAGDDRLGRGDRRR